MQRLKPCPRACRLAALVQLTALLAACTSWRSQPTSTAQLIASQKPSQVQVTRTDSTRLTLRDPQVHGDSLYGMRDIAAGNGEERIVLPLSQVSNIATLRPDPTKNTLLGAGIVVVTLSGLCLLADELGCDGGTNIIE